MARLRLRILVSLSVLFASGGCGSSSPTKQQLTDFVAGAQTSDGVVASFQRGAPPAANGGPTVAVTVSGSSSPAVVSGSSPLANLRASAPFQTVYVSVIDDPLDGFYKLDLPAATTETNVIVKLGPSLPTDTFQTVFSVALGNSVGPSSSLANTVKTATSVAVSGNTPTIGGAAQQFTATAAFSSGPQDVTAQATWQSSASNVAQVTSAGLVSAVGAGEADISATFGGVTGKMHVTISAQSATFTVSGRVNDVQMPNDFLPNVAITLGSRSTTTDGGGNYSFTGVNPGSVTVTASASGYVSSSQTVSVSGNTTVNFSLNRTPTAAITVQQGPCSAPEMGNVNCIFVGSSSNFPSTPTYVWTFRNAATGMSVSQIGQQVQPPFPCTFSNPPGQTGGMPFTVDVTLTVSGGGLTATASTSVTVARQGGGAACGG